MTPSQSVSERKVFRVAEITALIREQLESGFAEVWVQGEISNFRKPSSGHFYFTLKDEGASLRAVMFRFQNLYLRFRPEDGMEVLCRGRISIYDQRGEYQLLVDQMEPVGVGALQVKFEQLKAGLEKEGLFDQSRKRPIPEYPDRIAIITSPTGAAIRDMIRVFSSKETAVDILIIPSRVQGEGAAEELAKALDAANRPKVSRPRDRKPLELVILARGGGSLEDLWAFNEEVLARAIARSALPVLSAVGHEIDFTISDFTADGRAPTPTAAAELIATEKGLLREKVKDIRERIIRAIYHEHEIAGERLHWLARSIPDPRRDIENELLRVDDVFWKMERAVNRMLSPWDSRLQEIERGLSLQHPRARYKDAAYELEKMDSSLARAVRARLDLEVTRLEQGVGRLDALSPLATLSRGYSIARRPDTGMIISDSAQAGIGDLLELLLSRGRLECEVRGKSEPGGTD